MKCRTCKRGGVKVHTERRWPEVNRGYYGVWVHRLMTALGRREVCPVCGSVFTLKGDTVMLVLRLEVHALEVED